MTGRTIARALPALVLALIVANPAAASTEWGRRGHRLAITVRPQSPSPTVSFLSNQQFTTTWDRLRQDGGLAITVRNELARAQEVTLIVLGAQSVLRGTHRRLPGRAVRRLVVPLVSDKAPAHSISPAIVVASGATGALARRSFSATIPQKKAPARGATLTAADLTDQTLPATNFLPSLLNPYGPTLIVLAFGGALLVLILMWRASTADQRRLDRIVGFVVLAVLIGLLAGAAGYTFENRDDQQGVSLVSAKSLPVAGVDDGTYGVVTDDEADIAKLVVKASRLRPDGLDRAGAYSGKLDLTPGVDGGDATVKVNVRDWWLWAFAVIAFGVFVGWLLRRFFLKILPRDTLVAEAYQLEADATRAIFGLPGYSIEKPVAGEIARITTLARHDPDAATTAMATLRTNLDAYDRMARVLAALRDELQAAQNAARRAGVTDPGSVARFEKAQTLLDKPLVAFDKTEYDKRVDEAAAAESDLTAVLAAHAAAVATKKRAHELQAGKFGSDLKTLEAIEADLGKLISEVFLADLDETHKKIRAHKAELDQIAGKPAAALADLPAPGESGAAPAVTAAAAVDVSLPDRAAEAAQRVRDAERRGSLIAGALAVASGLSTLYFADGVWGTPGDYLAAALWGAAVSEGLKYVKAITDRTWEP